MRTNGWSGPGHQLGGAIAYYYLKDHKPEVIAKVIATLQNHPWLSNTWNDKLAGLSPEQKDVALFMLASTFPDDARSTPYGNGNRSKWHYTNYPYSPDNTATAPPQEINAEEKLISLISGLKGAKENKNKAIEICWLFHILEDIHQPLHTAALFDAAHTKGDRGGNDTYFHFTESGTPIKLHSFWDRLPKGTFANIPQQAQDLLKLAQYQASALPELDSHQTVNAWIKDESLPLAISVVYLNGKLRGTEGDPAIVDESYSSEAYKVAERRVVLSGIRLGMELIKIYS